MTLVDLECALKSEINMGRLGLPVALRIHALTPSFAGNLLGVLGCFRPLLALMGDVSVGEVRTRQHPSGKQGSVLWTEKSGRTALITLVSAPKTRQNLQVLLIGNHGLTLLEGGDLWSDAISCELPSLWEEEIQESLRKGTSIPVKTS